MGIRAAVNAPNHQHNGYNNGLWLRGDRIFLCLLAKSSTQCCGCRSGSQRLAQQLCGSAKTSTGTLPNLLRRKFAT